MNSSDRLLYERLHGGLEAGGSAVLATVVESVDEALLGKKHLVLTIPRTDQECISTLPEHWRKAVTERVERLRRTWPRSRRVHIEQFELPQPTRVAFERFEPAMRLVIAGGGHIAQPTHEIAATLGFSVTVIDDRPSFANAERFPRAHRVICDDFRRGVQSLGIDEATALVVVTRGHLHDLEVLRAVLNSRPAYLGMIGSRRRVLTVMEKLKAEGAQEAFLEKVYAPIGLDIGAETPAEIALAIVAEIVSVVRGGRGNHLRGTLPALSSK